MALRIFCTDSVRGGDGRRDLSGAPPPDIELTPGAKHRIGDHMPGALLGHGERVN